MTPSQLPSSNPWTLGEPDLQEMFDDLTIQLMMERDGVNRADLTDLLFRARKGLIAKRWREAA